MEEVVVDVHIGDSIQTCINKRHWLSTEHGWTSHCPWPCQERHWFEKGRRTEDQRTLALRRHLSRHCRAGAERFGTARVMLMTSRPGVVPVNLVNGNFAFYAAHIGFFAPKRGGFSKTRPFTHIFCLH